MDARGAPVAHAGGVNPVQPVASSLVSTAISSQDSPEFDPQGTPGGSGSSDRTDE